MIEQFVHFIVELVHDWGYWGIVAMTFLESTFAPIPSEVTMVPAGYLVYQGKMDFSLVLLCSILGTMGGSLFNYWMASSLGRIFFLRYGHYVFLPPEKLVKIERYFAAHGEISTFTGRLIPGVRHIISFPAGLAKMDLKKFCFYTFVGGTLWMLVLIGFGYFIGSKEEHIKHFLPMVTGAVVAAAGALVAGYIFIKRRRAKAQPADVRE